MTGDAPPAVRLGASKTILESALRHAEVLDVERRLSELEERLAGQRSAA